MTNALSIDLEDWYQVSDFTGFITFGDWDRYESRLRRNTERLLALLERFHTRATFFVLAWNAERDSGLVKDVHAAGHEIASHGYGHGLIYRQTPAEFRADLTRSLRILEAITGESVRGYRAPSFSITPRSSWALDVLLEEGLEYDSSVFPVRRGLYGWPGAARFPHVIRARAGRRLVEFPISTLRWAGLNVPFSGGGYLRLLPSTAVVHGIQWINRGRRPAVVYFHPWELDPDQPRLRPPDRRTLHYLNLASTEGKIEALLQRLRFAPLNEVLSHVGP